MHKTMEIKFAFEKEVSCFLCVFVTDLNKYFKLKLTFISQGPALIILEIIIFKNLSANSFLSCSSFFAANQPLAIQLPEQNRLLLLRF